MKHGSFGGLGSDRDMFYVEGSDDFRTYVWKVPEVSALLEGRDVVSCSEWTMNKRPGEIGASQNPDEYVVERVSMMDYSVGYSSSLLGPRYVPVDVSVPLARLTGE